MGGVGIGGYSGARTSPPFLPNIIVIAGRVAAFPRTLGVTIIIEVEQDDREMWQLSHYSFDGGYHGGTVRWSPSPRYSWMVHLNISKVFIGFLGTIHGYVSLREVSAFISTDVADDI